MSEQANETTTTTTKTETTDTKEPVQDTAKPESVSKGTVEPKADEKAANDPSKKDESAKDAPDGKKDSKETKPDGAKVDDIKFDLKLPKDSRLDAARVAELTSFAKDNKLSPEQAQAILNRDDANVKAVEKGELKGGAQYEKRVDGWTNALKADPEVGGESFMHNSELAFRVVKRFWGEDFQKELEQTGFGSHPKFFKGMVKVGKAMGEDEFFQAPNNSGGKKTPAETLYDKKS